MAAAPKVPKTMHTVSDAVAARLRQVIAARRLDVPRVAALWRDAGAPELTTDALHKILTRRESTSGRPRPVTVDEFMVLAAVLNCPPVSLLVPPDDHAEPYPITSQITAERGEVRAWVCGATPLREGDRLREYSAELPVDEVFIVHGEHRVIQSRPRRRTTTKKAGGS